jgi:hypothetical protein
MLGCREKASRADALGLRSAGVLSLEWPYARF